MAAMVKAGKKGIFLSLQQALELYEDGPSDKIRDVIIEGMRVYKEFAGLSG